MGQKIKSPTGYKYSLPDEVHKEYTFSSDVYNLCIKAADKLAELRAFSSFSADANFYLTKIVF